MKKINLAVVLFTIVASVSSIAQEAPPEKDASTSQYSSDSKVGAVPSTCEDVYDASGSKEREAKAADSSAVKTGEQ